MDNERPSELTSWSSRLEEPGALPKAGLTDKEAAWDRLYDRLKESENPRRRRMIWLWAVAACLLLIVVPAALLLKEVRKDPRRGVQPIPVAISPGKELKIPPTAPSSSNMAVDPTQPGGGETRPIPGQLARSAPGLPAHPAPNHAAPNYPAHQTPNHPAHPTMVRPDLNKLLAHDADTLTLVFAHPDLSRPPAIAASAPARKELRVVHINELDPPQPTPATTNGQRRRPSALRIELTSEEPFRPSTTCTEPAAHPILTFKHAQNP